MLIGSADFAEFVRWGNEPQSVWKNVDSLDAIHESQVEAELRALEVIARRGGKLDIAARLSRTFGMPGCRPNPLLLGQRFSAAIEYLESSVQKVVKGAKPRKNDRGLYVDYQMLLYLGRSDIEFLTYESFSGEVKNSPQKHRIVQAQTWS
jgi:hypothetical protein